MKEAQANNVNEDSIGKSKVPDWLVGDIFEDLLKENVKGYKETTNFKAYPAMAPGENYSTVMLRIEIEVKLEDGNRKTISYMIKLPTDNNLATEFAKLNEDRNAFTIEQGMYLEVIREMEEMFRDVGVDVQFGPNCYKLQTKGGHHYVLLEDLRPSGFKNPNRLEGLDMEHTRCVLEKLAKWHAASATHVANKGMYADRYMHSFFRDENKPLMTEVYKGFEEPLIKCLKSYKGNEAYAESVTKLQSRVMDEIFKLGKIDSNEFNVLNHGDLWSNNIMFQYDDLGKIKETFFVDYQGPKYGSPAQDLLYFILSSTTLEIKLKEFDSLIKLYYDHLVKCLRLLNYSKAAPTLKDVHIMLFKYGLWGYNTAIVVMAVGLLDPTENASLDTFLGDNDAGFQFRVKMYSNPRYRKHIEAVLPWLFKRGALEC